MVTIVATSDTHGRHGEVPMPDGDILIHAGDSTRVGGLDEFMRFAEWMNAQKKYKHRIWIAGNHELSMEDAANKKEILSLFDDDVIYLENEGVELEGIHFYGSPFTPEFFNWAFMKDDSDLAAEWKKIWDSVNVLITHGPPYSILDKNNRGDACGSQSLYEHVKLLPHLTHHIFGHLHHSHGYEEIDGMHFHNVCALDDAYRYKNPPQIIQIKTKEAI